MTNRRRIQIGSFDIAAWLVIALCLTATAVAAPPAFEDTIAQRMQACVGCHGDRGGGVVDAAFPRIAGQPVAYLATQLRAFRDGRRTYAPMNFLMTRQSDAYIDEMARYFAGQQPDPQVVRRRLNAPVDQAVFETGRQLVHQGRPEDGLPACVTCHGASMMGMLPNIPALAGLPREMLVEQVGSWKTGAHRSADNCMAQVARRMSGADIVAAATWLSRQEPVGEPEAAGRRLPLPCDAASR